MAEEQLETNFNAAADWVANTATSGESQHFTDAVKLTFYGLYKQAVNGKCNTGKPAFWSRAARLKWDAWHKLGSMTAQEAMSSYVNLLTSIVPDWADGGVPDEDAQGVARGGATTAHKGGHGIGGPVFSTFATHDNGDEDEQADQPENEGLHELAGKGDQQGVLQLLDAGMDVNARDKQGCTALHFAADRDQAEVASVLIAHGADVNAVDEDGSAPLHYAALCGNEKLASLLLMAGADPRLKDTNGATAREIAPATWQCWGEQE